MTLPSEQQFESEQVLEIAQTTGKEFPIIDSALISLEGIVKTLASNAGLTAAIALEDFDGARQLSITIVGGTGTGSIAITGTDGSGTSRNETLTFTNTERTKTTTHAYVSTGLTATPTTFTNGAANITGTILGNWLVQSSRKNAEERVWLNEFEAGDALTADIPIAEIQGSPSRVYQIVGDNPGVVGWKDDVYEVIWR